MNTQIELKDNEIPAWAFYENGEGLLSLIFFAKSSSHARSNAGNWKNINHLRLVPGNQNCSTWNI